MTAFRQWCCPTGWMMYETVKERAKMSNAVGHAAGVQAPLVAADRTTL
jgi:hypothetical protein